MNIIKNIIRILLIILIWISGATIIAVTCKYLKLNDIMPLS